MYMYIYCIYIKYSAFWLLCVFQNLTDSEVRGKDRQSDAPEFNKPSSTGYFVFFDLWMVLFRNMKNVSM